MKQSGAALDADVVANLFDRHAVQVYRYCARRVGPDVAEDIVGDVFLVVHRRRDRVQADDEALPWLYGIATNLLRNHRRAELRAYRALARTGVDPINGASGADEGHEARSAERADAGRYTPTLAAALAQLPARQRDVLLLHAIAELSQAEIAKALDIPLGSVQSALHRARVRLRTALGASGATEGL